MNFNHVSILVFISTCLFSLNSYAQLGMIHYSEDVSDGYILFKDPGGFGELTQFTLMNNCGQVINQWDGDIDYFGHAKLLPSGNLLFTRNNTIFEKNWDNEIVNEVDLISFDIQLDYETIKLENGNYLCVGRKEKDLDEFAEIGYTIDIGYPFVSDVVIEVDSTSGEILWQWDISEHTIQDRDPSLDNYGVISEHPELLNVSSISSYDWAQDESFMINGFDYNPELEQVLISVRKMSEVIIIDRTTTTEEAAGHTGGQYGKGGDVLFRWGNPLNYDSGTFAERKLYFQHNPKWITRGPHEGKISMFNNGLDRVFTGPFFSEAPVVDTQVDEMGNYMLDSNNQYASGEASFYYRPFDVNEYFYSGYLSGVEHMANGNAYFTIGEGSELIELNMQGKIVWQFNIPFPGFRTEKYPSDYPAFANRDLTPGDFLEYTEETLDCELVAIKDLDLSQIEIVHLQDQSFEIKNMEVLDLTYAIFDSQGRMQQHFQSNRPSEKIALDQLHAGYFVLRVLERKTGKFKSYSFIQTQ